MRQNWKVLTIILVGLVAIALFNTLTSEPEGYEAAPNRTTFNPQPSGYRAFYLWLKEQNVRVMPWMRDPKDLLTLGHAIRVLVMAEPNWSKPADAAAIFDWVFKGNTLVYISGNFERLFHALGVTSKSPELLSGNWTADRRKKSAIYLTPSLPTAYTAGVRTVAVTSAHRLVVARGPYVNYLEDRTGSVLSSINYGKGKIILLADPDLGANWNVAKEDNGLLLWNVLRAQGRDGYIAFDEYHHGYRETALLDYLRNSLWIVGFTQILVIAGYMVYSQGRRFARPLPVKTEDRQSALEYVQAMAHLYRGAQAYNQALANIYNRFKTRLCRKHGIAPTQPLDRIAAGAARKGAVSAGELAKTLAECEAAARGAYALKSHTLLALVKKLRDYERALRL